MFFKRPDALLTKQVQYSLEVLSLVLATCQKEQRFRSCAPVDRNDLVKLLKLRKISLLRVCPERPHPVTRWLGDYILSNHAHLESLSIGVKEMTETQPHVSNLWRNVLRYGPRGSGVIFPRLTCLYLAHINLTDPMLVVAINLPQLEQLDLRDCFGMIDMFCKFLQSGQELRLKSLTLMKLESRSLDSYRGSVLAIMGRVVTKCPSLQAIHLSYGKADDLRPTTLLDARCPRLAELSPNATNHPQR